MASNLFLLTMKGQGQPMDPGASQSGGSLDDVVAAAQFAKDLADCLNALSPEVRLTLLARVLHPGQSGAKAGQQNRLTSAKTALRKCLIVKKGYSVQDCFELMR